MSPAAFCGACGAGLESNTRFCPSCGAAQKQFATAGGEPAAPTTEQPTAPASRPAGAGADDGPRAGSAGGPSGPKPKVADRVEQISPGAGEFAAQLATQVQTPGVVAAVIAAAMAAAGSFVIALALALIYPDGSLLGAYGIETGLIAEALSGAASFLQISFERERIAPLLFVAIPVGLIALATMSQGSRTRSMSPRTRLAWGAAAGVPYALLMMVFAIAGGDNNPSVGGAFILGLLFGGLGGLLGARHSIRSDAPEVAGTILPHQLGLGARLVAVAVKPLALAFVACALIGTAAWWTQAIRDEGGARLGASVPSALSQEVAYSADFGVKYLALGAGASFRPGSPDSFPTYAIPADDLPQTNESPKRLFDYGDHISAPLFIPLLILLVGIPLLLALYAGYSVARAAGPKTPALAAAWGALVGPIWALGMVLLNAISQKLFAGAPVGDSVFATFLLGGAVLGALGGFLSVQAGQSPTGAVHE